MLLLRRDGEGGFTLAEWENGFVGLYENKPNPRVFHFNFTRWPCCSGGFELTLELLGFTLFAFNEGDYCEMEMLVEDVEPSFIDIETAEPALVT